MTFAVGSLVKTRGREWVVLPESAPDMLMVRPLGGTDTEITGICTELELVESAQFGLPDPRKLGDFNSCRLLRDALRLGLRSSAGPFRCFARLGFEPRPYQVVPLLMALRLNPVRLLIADDVGIGKTIEACLILRELMDRDEFRRFTVLCPPHLAEQWQQELAEKFHIHAEALLPGSATRLERQCGPGQSVFEVFPHTIVSTDFIKSDRRRDEFLRSCPELVLVDEAHTCAFSAERSGRHQRYRLIRDLARQPQRHLVLVTATPHSGDEGAFRSLLTLLDEGFHDLPEDLSGRENESHRRQLAQYFVQRRRGDIQHYLQANTPFPQRVEKEDSYRLTPDYQKLFSRVVNYARQTVADQSGEKRQHRVRWWSALALLRALASSPAAAAATLRNRAATIDAETIEEVDQIGQKMVLDMVENEAAEDMDFTPGVETESVDGADASQRRRLLDMAREADRLRGPLDAKLSRTVELLQGLLADGFHPIVFCRFIDTAEYVADELRRRLPKDVAVSAVTGLLAPTERQDRVDSLASVGRRVLVCTDCLSEGINLQEHFTAVFHYDLSWNPTRHEQREGRVDRFGQRAGEVRILTFYGIDNQIDGAVLEVLIRKHKSIRHSLGISVPVPFDTEKVIEAIFESLLLRKTQSPDALGSLFGDDFFKPRKEQFQTDWDRAADREKRSRTMFAQETIRVDEVARELQDAKLAIGSGLDLQAFMCDALRAHGAVIRHDTKGAHFNLRETPTGLQDILGLPNAELSVAFDLPIPDEAVLLTRTHPLVEKMAAYVLDTALDANMAGKAARCGVIRTRQVNVRTTVLLLRLRYQIVHTDGQTEHPLLAEDCQVVGFVGAPDAAAWLDTGQLEGLLQAKPDANISPQQATELIGQVIAGFNNLHAKLDKFAVARGEVILQSHLRVRAAARLKGQTRVEAKLPPDVVGIYIYLPVPKV